MNRTVLFTPVGGTDPISQNNGHDGAFIHICRVYKPTDVYMYMSAEMFEFHNSDDRYCYCLKRLCEHLDCTIEPHIIERPNLKEVHEFVWFYEEFRGIFKELFSGMDETDRLLVNISSGTPAMKSGLCVLMTMGEYPAALIQVATPVKKMNNHTHEKVYSKEFLELMWEADPDNEEDFENRCREIECPGLALIKNEEILKKYVLEYDYHAAVKMAQSMPAYAVAGYLPLLKIAEARKQLDSSGTDRLSSESGIAFIPVRGTDQRKYMEYALILDLKCRCGEYADFLRALTPLVVDLFELVLKTCFSIDINEYCFIDSRGLRKWNMRKLYGTNILTVLNNQYSGNFHTSPVYSAHLKAILDAQDSYGNPELLNMQQELGDLRAVEENVRNLAAHEIMCITDREIRQLTGFTSEQIMRKIKNVFPYTGINVREDFWNSYDEMNAEIIRHIGN